MGEPRSSRQHRSFVKSATEIQLNGEINAKAQDVHNRYQSARSDDGIGRGVRFDDTDHTDADANAYCDTGTHAGANRDSHANP
jgi:hypothetical protein